MGKGKRNKNKKKVQSNSNGHGGQNKENQRTENHNIQNGNSSTAGSSRNSGSSSTTGNKNTLPLILPGDSTKVEENPAILALQNDLVWNCFVQYLTHNQMKIISLVCKNFQLRIRDNKRFQNSSMAQVGCKSLMCPEFLNDPKWIWKHVKVNADIAMELIYEKDKKVMTIMQKRLQHTENLEILLALGPMGFVLFARSVFFIKPILGFTTPNLLKSLTLHCSLLGCDMKDCLRNSHVKNVLKNLEELHISAGPNVGVVRDNSGSFQHNMKALASIPKKLKAFSWGKIDTSPKGILINTYFAVVIVENNRLTLERLRLELYAWCLEAVGRIVCPELKDLSVFARFKNYKNVISFLKKQPLLESLDLEFYDYCPTEVLETVLKRSQKLKKFRLKTKDFEHEGKVLKCLKGMTKLEEFEVHIAQYVEYTQDDFTASLVLKALPTSITRLTLGRLHSGGIDFLCDHVCETCPEFDLCNCENSCACTPVAMAQHVIPRLERFVHLTELTILNRNVESENEGLLNDSFDVENCTSMVDDAVLQFIIANMSKLRVLRFSHCPYLTDFGITGIPLGGGQDGLPISHLKDLRELMIKDCPELSEDCLQEFIVFPRLITLNLDVWMVEKDDEDDEEEEEDMWSKSELIKIVKQNPCLTTLVIHFTEKGLEEELKAANPSLLHVHNTHTQHCSGVYDVANQDYYKDPFTDTEFDNDENYTTSEPGDTSDEDEDEDSDEHDDLISAIHQMLLDEDD